MEQLEQSALKLSEKDCRCFAKWFYEHRDELISDCGEIDPEVKAEILRRRDEAHAHSELFEVWEGTTERVRVCLNEIRGQKNKAG